MLLHRVPISNVKDNKPYYKFSKTVPGGGGVLGPWVQQENYSWPEERKNLDTLK